LIDKEKGEFYTEYRGEVADVSVRTHPTTGTKFLWSQPDGCLANNIDNLKDI
jgi:hypothetical protein